MTKERSDDHHLVCVVGGEDGSMQVVNLTELLRENGVEQNHQIFTVKKSIKCEIHNLKTAVYH